MSGVGSGLVVALGSSHDELVVAVGVDVADDLNGGSGVVILVESVQHDLGQVLLARHGSVQHVGGTCVREGLVVVTGADHEVSDAVVVEITQARNARAGSRIGFSVEGNGRLAQGDGAGRDGAFEDPDGAGFAAVFASERRGDHEVVVAVAGDVLSGGCGESVEGAAGSGDRDGAVGVHLSTEGSQVEERGVLPGAGDEQVDVAVFVHVTGDLEHVAVVAVAGHSGQGCVGVGVGERLLQETLVDRVVAVVVHAVVADLVGGRVHVLVVVVAVVGVVGESFGLQTGRGGGGLDAVAVVVVVVVPGDFLCVRVDFAVAVVVDAVLALFDFTRVDVRVRVVAVGVVEHLSGRGFAVGFPRVGVAVAIAIGVRVVGSGIDDGVVGFVQKTVAVVVDAVADLVSSGVDAGVEIVAVRVARHVVRVGRVALLDASTGSVGVVVFVDVPDENTNLGVGVVAVTTVNADAVAVLVKACRLLVGAQPRAKDVASREPTKTHKQQDIAHVYLL